MNNFFVDFFIALGLFNMLGGSKSAEEVFLQIPELSAFV